MNLAGLSAVYPGFQQAENTQATTEQNQAAAKEAALKLLGQHVLGRALTGGQSGQGPMPPQPGQASMPSQPQGGVPAAPPVQGGPAPALAPQAAATPSGAPEINLQSLTQRILATSPRVKDHPEVLMAALERASPLLDRQSREDLAELRKQMTTQRLEQAGELAKARIEQQKAAEAGKQGRFDAREARLSASTAVRQDQSWQRLEMQKQDLERKVQQGGDKQALSQWRAIVDAQHKRATEIIQSNSKMSDLPEADRKALLAEQNAAYAEQIAAMRGKMSQPAQGAPAASAAPIAPAAAPPVINPPSAANAPPLAVLKPNTITTFQNGQKWTIGPDGQPKQVP